MNFEDLLYHFRQRDIFLEKDFRLEGKTCCLIGNSGKILDEEKGNLIDECDFIIRMNASKVEGYEKHVGTRTDLRFVNQHSFYALNLPRTAEGHKDVFPEFDADFLKKQKNQTIVNVENVDIFPEKKSILESNGCSVIHFDDFTFQKIKSCHPKPTTGYLSLMTAVSFFEKIYVIGFDFYENPEKEHYFEKTVPYDRTNVHNIIEEKRIFFELLEKNEINWL